MTSAEAEKQTFGRRAISFAIAGFILTCVVLFAIGGLIAPESEPGFTPSTTARPNADGTFSITLDAQGNKDWTSFSFGRGKVGVAPADVLVQRSIFRAPHGAIDLGEVPLASAKLPENAEWVSDRENDGALQNPAIGKWYSYSYWTHLLSPRGHTYAVRRADGGIAYFRITSYYCSPEGSGCVTLNYRLEQGS